VSFPVTNEAGASQRRLAAQSQFSGELRWWALAFAGVGRLRSKRSRVRVAPGPLGKLCPRFDFG
jgi:hypothetical protein